MKELLNKIVEKIVVLKKMEAVHEYTERFAELIMEKDQLLKDLYDLVVGKEEVVTDIDLELSMSVEKIAFMNIMKAIYSKVDELLAKEIEQDTEEEIEEESNNTLTIPKKTLYDTRIAKENNDMNTHYHNTRILNIWARDNNIDWRELSDMIYNSTEVNKMSSEEKEIINKIENEVIEAEEKSHTKSRLMLDTHLDAYDFVYNKHNNNEVKEEQIELTEENKEESIEEVIEETDQNNELVLDGYKFPNIEIRDRYLRIKGIYKGRLALTMEESKVYNAFQKYKINNLYKDCNIATY